jgi:carbonic anhydrase
MGSIEFALTALSDSVKCVVMLGHSGCGAVTGAVDCYLKPLKFWSKSFPPMLKTILQRIFVAVREGANALREVWGPDARQIPGYREALIDIAVSVNAAQAAFDLRQEVERAAKWEIKVLYGVFSLHNHQVSMPVNPRAPVAPENVNLAYAPANPREFSTMAHQMAELLKPASLAPTGRPGSGDGAPHGGLAAANPRNLSLAVKNELLLRPDEHLGRE